MAISIGPKSASFKLILQALILVQLGISLGCDARPYFRSVSTETKSVGDGNKLITTIVDNESSSLLDEPQTEITEIVETSKSVRNDLPMNDFNQSLKSLGLSRSSSKNSLFSPFLTSVMGYGRFGGNNFGNNFNNNIINKSPRGQRSNVARSLDGNTGRSDSNPSAHKTANWIADDYYRNSNPYARDIAKLLRIKQGHYADLYQRIDSPNRQEDTNPFRTFEKTVSSVVQQLEQELNGKRQGPQSTISTSNNNNNNNRNNY